MFIFIFLLGVQGLFENSYTIKTLNKLEDFVKVLESDFVSLVYFYSEECENCKRASYMIEKVAEDQEGIINVYGADCDQLKRDEQALEKLPYCQNLNELPQISFFEPPKYKINPYTQEPMIASEHRFAGEASPQKLGEYGHQFIPNYVYRIKNMDEYLKFEKSDDKLSKVILFTKKQNTAAIYKALAVNYYERVKFGEVVDSEETRELIDEFDITDFPQIIALENNGDNNYSREIFEGDLTFRPMKKFIRSYASKERFPFEHSNEEIKKRERRQSSEQQDDVKEEKIEVITLDESVLNKKLFRNDKPALVHIHREDEQHKAWEEVMKKYKNLFDYYSLIVNDQQSENLAKEMAIKSLPSIKFYQVGNLGKKKAMKIAFAKSQSMEEIHRDIVELIDDKTFPINEQTLQMQLSQSIQENKICVLYFYETPQIGLTYRVLSQLNEYYEKYRFYSFRNAPQEILGHFQITKQPALTIIFRDVKDKKELEEELKQEQVRQALFTGKMNYDEVKHFFDSFDDEKKTSSKKIKEINTQEEFEETCQKQSKICYITLLNGEHKKEKRDILTKWEYQLEIFERIKNAHGQMSGQFVYIDAACHDELLMKFDIAEDSLPNFVIYNSLKNQYSKLIGVYDYESINRFMEKFAKQQVNTIPVRDIQVIEKDCEEVFQKRNQSYQQGISDLDEEILKEILEEERKKKEQIKKELKKDKKKSKKKKDDL